MTIDMHSSEQRRGEERGERPNARNMMEMRYRESGDVDVEGVSDAEKAAFLAEKLRAIDDEAARIAAERAKLAELYAKASGGAAFTAAEKEWFERGEDEGWLALAAAWEAERTLDVDDVPDATKHAFAVEKRAHIEAALRAGHGDAEGLHDALARLDILIDQYKDKN